MKLTIREENICYEHSYKVVSARGGKSVLGCHECPLYICMSPTSGAPEAKINVLCYASIDGRSAYARKLKRF